MIYHYVGPADVRTSAGTGPGLPPRSASLSITTMWTYVVSRTGVLLVAPRNSEHVACAGGEPVLAAGEISFTTAPAGWQVDQVTNQSTGYCPEPSCWPAVAAALDAAGIAHGDGFTAEFTFRRCPGCATVNLIKEDVYLCAVCDTELPAVWNFAEPA